MSDRACTADSTDEQEGADGGYFAPLAPARYVRITTFGRQGSPVSASAPVVTDGNRAYFRARSRSGTVKRLTHADAVQATPCAALGFYLYGPPLDAITRRLSGDAARLAAAKLDSRHPPRRRFPIRLLRRQAVYYELLPGAAADDQDRPGGASEPLIVRVLTRQETSCANATTPTSLATVYAPAANGRGGA